MKCRKTKCERFRAVAGEINNWHHRNRNGLVVGRGAGRASAEGLMVVHPAQDAHEGLRASPKSELGAAKYFSCPGCASTLPVLGIPQRAFCTL